MTILLDSHAFFWWATADRKLSGTAYAAIDEDDQVYISAVVAWEIASKIRSGKWPEARLLADDFFATIAHYEFHHLPVTLEHAHLAGSMPARHRDPFDRLLAAQARIEDVALVTADPAFREFEVRLVW
jgi:PIN domain nuclease of toxin-antitoxin system